MVGETAARNVVIITTHHAKDLESLGPTVLTLK
jgi:hypothetical protein